MSYQTAKWVDMGGKTGPFALGYVDNTQNLFLAEGMTPYARNFRLDGNSAVIRPGHDLLAELVSGSYPKGIGAYYRANPANNVLVIRSNYYAPAYLTGGNSATSNIATRQGAGLCSFKITIDGISREVGTISFASATTMEEVASYIQFAIRTATGAMETCVWDTNHFIITSANITSSSAITVTSASALGGTDISGAGATEFMDCEVGIGTVTNAVSKQISTVTSGGIVTNISTSSNITSDNRMTFNNIGDVIYCMNGVDNLGKLSGTTYTTPSTGISSFAPSFSVVFNSSHWASGWSANPNKVYKSVGDNYDDFNSSGSDTFTFEDVITGLATNDQAIFYFTKNTISVTDKDDITDTAGTLSYITRPVQTKEGAINHSSIVPAGSRVFFITPSKKICEIARGQNIDGFEVNELSERKYAGISKIMSELDDDLSTCFGYFLPKENLIKWFFKNNGSAIHDICIVYDVNKDLFQVDNGKYFYGGTHFDGRNYTISMVEGKVYRDEYGMDDEGGAIPFEYRTKEYYISDPTFKKTVRETRSLVDINQQTSLEQQIWIDGGQVDSKTVDVNTIVSQIGGLDTGGIGTGTVGTFATGTEGAEDDDFDDSDYNEISIIRTKGNLNVRGYKMQFRYYNTKVASKVRLKNISAKVEVLSELTNNLT